MCMQRSCSQVSDGRLCSANFTDVVLAKRRECKIYKNKNIVGMEALEVSLNLPCELER